jgi:hypothetical protein
MRGLKPQDDRPDWSAEERYINRSIKIRKHVLLWMDTRIALGGDNKAFTSIMGMAAECANDYKPNKKNYIPFSSQCAYSWLNQFSVSNGPFAIVPGDLGYELVRRRALSRQDFVRWGVTPPKRFRKRKK